MRTLLSNLMTESAKSNPEFVVLSGDHGYALFDQLRRERGKQFINVGVAEQMMIGVAAGLAKQGMKPLVYGLAAFVPVRVLEQIKLDLCFSKLPVILLGDGAGLVYSTLGASHQCAEDLACLRPLPHLKIFSPADAEELRVCYREALEYSGPSYIRLGKSDRPVVSSGPHASSDAYIAYKASQKSSAVIVATSSMVAPGCEAGRKFGVSCISVPRIKPFPAQILDLIGDAKTVITMEEHNRHGGLTSALTDEYAEKGRALPKIHALTLKDKFSHLSGGYQYALSEHDLSDTQIMERVKKILS